MNDAEYIALFNNNLMKRYTPCNSQTATFYVDDPSETFESNYFGIDSFCWYRFYPDFVQMRNINIKINSIQNAIAEVYYEEGGNTFEYRGTLSCKNII